MKTYVIGKHSIEYDQNKVIYNSSSINWDEVTDFRLEHSYINGTGGLDFHIYSKSSSINISESVFFPGSKKKYNRIKELLDVINEILPFIMIGFAKTCLAKIKSNGFCKIGRFYFKLNTIEYKPGFLSIKKNVELPYKNASLLIDNVGLGFFGSKGNTTTITLVDTKNFKEYYCGNATSSKYSQSNNIKAKMLLKILNSYEK